jgi:hypothetical protein
MRKVNEFDKKITDCFFFYKNIIEKKLKKLKKKHLNKNCQEKQQIELSFIFRDYMARIRGTAAERLRIDGVSLIRR